MNDVMTDSACRRVLWYPIFWKTSRGPFGHLLSKGIGWNGPFYFSQKQRDFFGKLWYTIDVR